MPGWHVRAQEAGWLQRDDFVIVGVTQEQHPQRCRLFAQWHQIEWPILHDPITLLAPTAVPLTVAIDEHGVVRSTRPNQETFEKKFLDVDFPDPQEAAPQLNAGPAGLEGVPAAAHADKSWQAWMAHGDALLLWRRPTQFNETLHAYQQASSLSDGAAAGRVDFRLGVLYRMRFESSARKDGDFQRAVDAWQAALAKDPNQYIWRRRIQQYGPRLDKPYPFYDWIDEAREAIRARADEPLKLAVEPRGAELARPQTKLELSQEQAEEVPARLQDAEGRVNRDQRQLVRVQPTVVRGTGKASQVYQLHVRLQPTADAHWNNETDPVVVWLQPRGNVSVDKEVRVLSQPEVPESTETRQVEFEVRFNDEVSQPRSLRGYVLYNVCEEAGGQCLFLRQDFSVQLPVDEQGK